MAEDEFIFTFHGIGAPARDLPTGEADLWVESERFGELIRWLAERDERIGVTFDDGNASDSLEALPRLLEARISSSFFLSVGMIGRPGYLTASQVRELANEGMTIGSHGVRHVPWRGLGDADLEREVRESRLRLEDLLGRAVHTAACPFGSYDRRVVRRARAAGYRTLYTSDRGAARAAAFLKPRNSIRRDDDPESLLALLEARANPLRRAARAAKLLAKRSR